jgi:hypothetical protein
MRQKVARHARQPLHSQRIETSLLQGVEDRRSRAVSGSEIVMNRRIVEPPLQHDAIRERAQAAVCGCAGLLEERLRALDFGKGTATRRNGAKMACAQSTSFPIQR